METLFHICPDLYKPSTSNTKFTNTSIYDIMEDIAISVNDITIYCEWREEFQNCTDFFEPIFTDDGLCFVFNALNSHEMYTDR